MKLTLRTLAALLFCVLMPAAQAKRAPNLELKDLKGNKQTISSLRGSIVVINFWATWCAPCREELPLLSKLSQGYAGKGVRFIAVSADEAKDRARIDEFLNRNSLALDVWVGADLDMLESAGLGNELPATMILDEQGEIVARILGQAHEEDVRVPVEWLLNGRSGQAPLPVTKRYGHSFQRRGSGDALRSSCGGSLRPLRPPALLSLICDSERTDQGICGHGPAAGSGFGRLP